MSAIHKIGEGNNMSSKVLVVLEDDLDGSKASETVTFAIDGTQYEIDLNDQNAKKLRDALDGYVSKARKLSGKRSNTRKTSSGVDSHAVRVWATSNGIKISDRGRIPADVVAQFRAAGN
jgi:phage-related tail protein